MEITMRSAQEEDAKLSYQFIEDARLHQREQGFVQWPDNYPDFADILEDIRQKRGYLLTWDSIPFGYLCIDFNGEAAYQTIEGNWKSQRPYAVIHRMAIGKAGRNQGASKTAFRLVKELCLSKQVRAVRADTGCENRKMQHILEREGFQYCGIIYYSGNPRLAYELDF